MKLLTLFIFLAIMLNTPTYRIDFGDNKDGQNWRIINDGVMGGLSQGEGALTEESVLFKGKVSLANNGGFSSLKSPFQRTDLSAFSRVKVRYRSTGYKVALTLETSETWFRPYFKLMLDEPKTDWQTVEYDLSEFEQYQVGRKTDYKLQKTDLEQVLRIGFITSEKRAGDFEIEVDYIEFL